MISYVAAGRETRPSARRSSIWISVWLRSWASTMWLSISGWADMDGGARRRVRAPDLKGTAVRGEKSKSSDSSTVKEGDIFWVRFRCMRSCCCMEKSRYSNKLLDEWMGLDLSAEGFKPHP